MEAGQTPSSTKIDQSFWENFTQGNKVLDIGCGWGRGIFECLKRQIVPVGVDINQKEIAELQKKLPGVRLLEGNFLETNPGNGFDGAMMLGYLSALPLSGRGASLANAGDCLRSGGYLLVSEFELHKKFRQRYEEDFKITGEYGTLCAMQNGKEVFWSHNFNKEELCSLIEENGFKITKFKRADFISYHGEAKPGMMITAQKI